MKILSICLCIILLLALGFVTFTFFLPLFKILAGILLILGMFVVISTLIFIIIFKKK